MDGILISVDEVFETLKQTYAFAEVPSLINICQLADILSFIYPRVNVTKEILQFIAQKILPRIAKISNERKLQ
jgi:hypothetical protein